jgi:hypothetical protein
MDHQRKRPTADLAVVRCRKPLSPSPCPSKRLIMALYRCVILQHTTPDGQHHYDWLFERPEDPLGPLWAGRVPYPPPVWPRLANWPVQQLGDHRRRYLHYQGPLSRGRGTVERRDSGTLLPIRWTPDESVLDIALGGCAGRLVLHKTAPDEAWWTAALTDQPDAGRGRVTVSPPLA